MSLAVNPGVESRSGPVSIDVPVVRRRPDGPTIALGVILFAFAIALLASFVPAISEPDDNGYFAQGSLLFTTGHTWFRPASDAQYIGMHWLLSPSGEFISRYPPGLAVLIGAVYAIAGYRAAVMVNPALAIAMLVGAFCLARRLGLTRWWAIVPVLVLAANPTVLQHALAGDSHIAVACVLVWGTTLLLRWSQEGRARDLFFAGLVLGLIPTIRYPDAVVAVGVAWFVWSHRRVLHESRGVLAPDIRTEDGPALNSRTGSGPALNRSWNRAVLFGVAGAMIPILPLLVRNQLLLGGFWKTGYALTNEQTGFGLNYFLQHALQYIQQIQSGGLGLFFALGIVGITLMICVRRERAVGVMFAWFTLPMLLLYMAYYWAPQMSGATMRFLLPTFPMYVLAGVWAIKSMTDRAPTAAKIAVPAVAAATQLLWSAPDAIQQTQRLTATKRPLAMMTDALERDVKPGSVVVASGLLAQHLDFVRHWKLADASMVTGRGGGPGGGPPMGVGGGMFNGMFGGRGRGGTGFGGGADQPSPMQSEKRERSRTLYPGTMKQKQAKFASDLLAWAGGESIYVVGTESDVREMFSEVESNLQIVERVKLPAMMGPGGPGGGPGMGGLGMGGPMGGGFGGRRGELNSSPTEWVIAKWSPA